MEDLWRPDPWNPDPDSDDMERVYAEADSYSDLPGPSGSSEEVSPDGSERYQSPQEYYGEGSFTGVPFTTNSNPSETSYS